MPGPANLTNPPAPRHFGSAVVSRAGGGTPPRPEGCPPCPPQTTAAAVSPASPAFAYLGSPDSPFPLLYEGWEDVDACNPEASEAIACAGGLLGELPLYHTHDRFLPTGLHRFFAYETPVGTGIGAMRYAGVGAMGAATFSPSTIAPPAQRQPAPPPAKAPPPTHWVQIDRSQIPLYRGENVIGKLTAEAQNAFAQGAGGAFYVIHVIHGGATGTTYGLNAPHPNPATWTWFLLVAGPLRVNPGLISEPPSGEGSGAMGADVVVISGGKDPSGDEYQPDPSTGEPIPQDSASCHWTPDASNSAAVAIATSISYHGSPVAFTDQGVYNTLIGGVSWRFVMWKGDCRGDGGSYNCVSAFRCVPKGGVTPTPGGGGVSTASMVGGGLVLAVLIVGGIIVSGFAGRGSGMGRHMTEALLY